MPPRKPLTAAQARERERKLIARKERNRASAAAHRERKNATIDELTIQVNKLQEENRRLQALAEENRQLRAALAAQASSVEVEAPPQPPVPQQRAPLQQPSQMLLRIPLVPNHVACQNTNPLPAAKKPVLTCGVTKGKRLIVPTLGRGVDGAYSSTATSRPTKRSRVAAELYSADVSSSSGSDYSSDATTDESRDDESDDESGDLNLKDLGDFFFSDGPLDGDMLPLDLALDEL